MPFINGRFYMNPTYGRVIENARDSDAVPRQSAANQKQAGASRWVTINGRHVLIQETQAGHARDKAYLDRYYNAVSSLAKKYNVDPALVLGLGIESGFASQGTYARTGDAFGMTGGSTTNMTTAASPAENVQKFFDNYGNQIRGTGSDIPAFINGLEGREFFGQPVKGWKVYNSANSESSRMIGSGISQMRRDIPTYLSQRNAKPVVR
jgi:hypothetical protein